MSPRDDPRVAIVTGDSAPQLTEDGQALAVELDRRGYDPVPVVWTDSGTDWSTFDLVLVRSCWEYHEDPATFRELLRRADRAGATVRNPPAVIRWNMHKSYLLELEATGVSVPPTVWIEREEDIALAEVLESLGGSDVVVKPTVGTSSEGVWRATGPITDAMERRFATARAAGDVLVQQFLPAISSGELSFVFVGGAYSHASRTIPRVDDFRAHGSHGAEHEPFEPSRTLVSQARAALTAATERCSVRPADLPYARVDGVEREGAFTLLELELVEPYLGLCRAEGSVPRFLDALERSIDCRVSVEGHA